MKDRGNDPGVVIPKELKNRYKAVMGWSAKAVDSLADRLVFLGFKEDNFGLEEIFNMNNPDTLADSAILSALIGACSFIYISPDEDGYPRLQVIDGGNATGVIDPITGLLKEGYAVLSRDDRDNPVEEAYFTAEYTEYYNKDTGAVRRDDNPAPYPLLVPIINRPDAKRVFGHSRISRNCMYLQQLAKRTLIRTDIAAEFYSYPQRYVLGTDPDADQLDKWKAVITTMLQIDRGAEGNPVVGQFQQQSMTPYNEQLRTIAAMFSGETGLTLDDLGFVTENPSSAEAIKAAHENLRLTARKAQRTFGSGFLNAGYLAACLRDEFPYQRRQVYLTTPKWAPVFEADAAALSAYGDGVIKINQALEGYITDEKFEDLTGI